MIIHIEGSEWSNVKLGETIRVVIGNDRIVTAVVTKTDFLTPRGLGKPPLAVIETKIKKVQYR